MIYIARHGETVANVEHIWQGQSGNASLNAKGRLQAQKLAHYMRTVDIEKIVASPLKRAHETAEIIAKTLDMDVTLDERLMEMKYGEFEKKKDGDLQIMFKDTYDQWRTSPWLVTFPRGESLKDTKKRAHALFNDYSHYKNILFVSHEDMIRAMIVEVSGKDKEYWENTITNTSLTTFDNSDPDNLTILDIGQTVHLTL